MILDTYFIWIVLILGTSALFLILLSTTTYYLVGHSNREKISYKSFMQRIKYFDVQMNPFIQGLFYLTLFGLGIFVLYTAFTFNAEVRYYTLPFLILFVLILLLYFIYPVLGQLDEDMTEYKHNYQKVKQALLKKEEAEESIKKTIEYKTNITSLINDFERQIRTVEDPKKFNLKDSISIIDEFAASQTKTINNYEKEILDRFEKTLSQYFEHKIAVPITLPKTSLNFEEKYNSVRTEVFDKYHKIFNETLYVLIDTRKYNTSKIITGGLQILKNNEFSPTQELIELILLSIDNIEGSPRELIDYILNKKIVELEELISYAINKKILWVFKNNIFETQEQLSTISERLIKEDAYTQGIAFISNYFTRLKNVLAFTEKIKENNKTLNLFHSYKRVMNVDANFYNESRVYENKLLSVKGFFDGRRKTDQLKRELQDISKVEKAYHNRADIDKLYQTVQDRFDDLKLNATQSLLLYSGISEENGMFDVVKTSKLFNDFYNRLLMKDLLVASLLLYSIFIYSTNDEDLYKEVIDVFKNTKEYSKELKDINLDRPFTEHKILSRDIIQNVLFKREQSRLANIVVNLENERLTLNKLAKIR